MSGADADDFGRLSEVANSVYAWVQPDGGWCLSNAGIVRSEDSLVVVDTAATERRAMALLAATRRIDPAPVRTVVNTHHHGDHTFGNAVFSNAVVVAHHECRAAMARSGVGMRGLWPDVEWGDLPLALPGLTVGETSVLHASSTEIHLIHPGPAHTTGDLLAWLPEQGVLFAGDLLMADRTPFLLMGSVRGMRAAVSAVRTLAPAVIVCGHGPVCGPQVLDATEAYLDALEQLAAEGVAEGRTPLEVARSARLGPFAEWGEPERIVANLHRAMFELRGAAPGQHLSSAAPWTDMALFSGGVAARCRA